MIFLVTTGTNDGRRTIMGYSTDALEAITIARGLEGQHPSVQSVARLTVPTASEMDPTWSGDAHGPFPRSP